MRLVFSIFVLLAGAALAAPDHVARWKTAELRPGADMRADKAVALYVRTAARYKSVEAMRADGVPAPVIFCLHYRESSNSFACHLHEGSPLMHHTRDVPKGRIPGVPPPYTWEQSAKDALYVCDRLQGDWRQLATALNRIEAYNGTGYARFHPSVPSPYLWSGTTIYSRGKYTADGRFNPIAVDGQLGCAAILKRMRARGVKLPF